MNTQQNVGLTLRSEVDIQQTHVVEFSLHQGLSNSQCYVDRLYFSITFFLVLILDYLDLGAQGNFICFNSALLHIEPTTRW